MHEPWRLSAYQIQSALLGVPAAARVTATLAAPEEITPPLADEIRDGLSYPERTRLTHLFALLHDAGQPGRGFRERRALRRQARAEWQALAGPDSPGEPRLPPGYPALAQAWQECSRQLSALAAFAPLAGLDADPEAAVAALAADKQTPWKLPRLHELPRASTVSPEPPEPPEPPAAGPPAGLPAPGPLAGLLAPEPAESLIAPQAPPVEASRPSLALPSGTHHDVG